MTLENRIDFVGIIVVKNANPNGDPLNGNLPRTDNGYGIISDVCLKSKVRGAAYYFKNPIFVIQPDMEPEYKCMKARALENEEYKKACNDKDMDKAKAVACRSWYDVRAFGQVLPYSGKKTNEDENLSIYGPVSISSAKSIAPVSIETMQISKCVPGSSKESASDTFGSTSYVDFGIYVFKGDISANLAEKTGFSEEDAETLKQSILHMFDHDSSCARPAGSIWLEKLYWFKHSCKNGNASKKKVHDSVKVTPKRNPRYFYRDIEDFDISCDPINGVDVEVYGE